MNNNPIGALIIGAIILALYFAPTMTAIRRDHHNKAAITALNFLLGWTVLGWIIAFVWAYTNPTSES